MRRIHNNTGIALVMVVVIVAIAAIAFATALHVLGETLTEARSEHSRDRLTVVETAILGSRSSVNNGFGGSMGYFGFQNNFPPTTAGGTDADILIDDGFLPNPFGYASSFPASVDGFGTGIEFIQDDGSGNFVIQSAGADRAYGSADDIEISMVRTAYLNNTIYVEVADAVEMITNGIYGLPTYAYAAGHRFATHTQLDDDNIDVSIEIDSGGVPAQTLLTYDAADGRFESASDIPAGAHQLIIAADNIDDVVPQWNPGANNELRTSIYVAPSTTPQTFQVEYPIKPIARYKREQGFSGFQDRVPDKMVCSDNTNIDWAGIPDLGELVIGNYSGTTSRALLRFNLSDFDNPPDVPALTNNCKVIRAYVTLFEGIGSSNDATIELHEYLGAVWNGGMFGPLPDENAGHTWGNVNTADIDYRTPAFASLTSNLGAIGEYEFELPPAYIETELNADGIVLLMIKLDDTDESSGKRWDFYCAEVVTGQYRPRLTIEYYRE